MNASTTPSTPAPEVAALVGKVNALSKLALDMTRLTMDISAAIPDIVDSQVAQAIDALNPPSALFVHGTAATPAELDARFPPGTGDYQTWYVVIVGREPGLYGSSVEADAQVNGIPGQLRRKKTSRREALDFYRTEYNDGHVDKVHEVPTTATAPVAAAAPAAPVAVAAPAAATQ